MSRGEIANAINSAFLSITIPITWPLHRMFNDESETMGWKFQLIVSFTLYYKHKPAIIKSVDPNQFGTIPGSSTVMPLISMLHWWLGDTDGTDTKNVCVTLWFP